MSGRKSISRGHALAGAVAIPSAAPNPDADLIQLGAAFEAEQTRYAAFFAEHTDTTDDEADAACRPCGDLAGKIQALRATTIEGLRIKAMALRWCWSGEEGGDLDLSSRYGMKTTDMRLASSIILDLITQA